jgi:hypothetical protein
MRGFRSATQLQRFASVHGAVQYLFRSADTFCGLLVAVVRAFFRDLRSPPQSRTKPDRQVTFSQKTSNGLAIPKDLLVGQDALDRA